jgi:hypothetical protein
MPCQTRGTWEGAMYHQETLVRARSSREAERTSLKKKVSLLSFLLVFPSSCFAHLSGLRNWPSASESRAKAEMTTLEPW